MEKKKFLVTVQRTAVFEIPVYAETRDQAGIQALGGVEGGVIVRPVQQTTTIAKIADLYQQE